MTLYTKQVIFNPINLWLSGRSYFIGNQVENDAVFYQCNTNNTASVANEPPNASFWDVITPTSPNVDVSDFVETVFDTEIGSGEVRSCKLRFNADRGAFITNSNSGLTPLIDQFDKFTVKLTDENSILYLATYEVDIIHPTQDGLQGKVLPVDLLGPEFYLQKTLFADQFFFESLFDVSSGIVDFYNTNKGTRQVRITGADADSASGGFNDLPVWTANDFTFNLKEMTHYDGLIQTMDRGGSSVASGGAGDFFEIAFTTNSTNAEEINFRGFSSGNPSDQSSIPNIKSNSIIVNPAEQEGEIVSTFGNVVGTWTDSSIGTLPRTNADFIGALEAWRLFPEYVSGATYPSGAIILVVNTLDDQGDSFHYKTNKETSIAPPTPPTTSNADWDQYQFTDFLTTEVSYNFSHYSFWTDAKSIQWRSNGAVTGGNIQEDPPTANSIKVWDSNQVKIDGTVRETWVDVIALNFASIPSGFKRNSAVYRGFRVLVNGTGTSEFAGFDNDVIQWDGTQWIIFLIPEDENLVCVDDEGATYQFDSSGSTWTDITTSTEQANDVYHSVYNITNTQGHNKKNNGLSGGSGAVITVSLTLGVITDVTISNGGSGYTSNAVSILEGGTPILDGQIQLSQTSGVIDGFTIIGGGFGYSSTPTLTVTDDGGNFGQTCAVTYEFRYEKGDSISGFGTPSFYRQFAGVNFRVPYPFNANNGNTLGEDYGDSDELVPATFEAENMGLTSSGLSGFNNLEAEDLGPFDALTFFINHNWTFQIDGSGGLVQSGNFSYRCALYDIDDTVVVQDFVIAFNNLWESVSLPIAGFKTYKARAAWAFGNTGQNLFLQELEILNSFRWRNIKKIAIHWLGPYDDQGRFQPWGQKEFLFPSFISLLTGLFVDGYNIKLSIDSFQWSKPGLSLSPPNTTRPLQPEFFYEPLITNKYQNDQANLAKLEITQFRHKEFEVTTVGRNDITFGDSFFLENSDLISDSDRTVSDLDSWVTATAYTTDDDVQDISVGYRCIINHTSSGSNQPPNVSFWVVLADPIPNTIKLVAKKIVRAIDKRPDGPGGYLRTITGVRRFVEGEQ